MFVYRLKDLYYNIKRGVKNVWYYIPIVWDNNNWDHGYCLRLYTSSLKRLHDTLVREDFVVRTEHELRKLKSVIELLERYEKDEYEVPACDELDRKYNIIEEDKRLEFEPCDNPNYSRLVNTKERKLGEEVYSKYSKELTQIYKDSVVRKKNELRLALKIIERNHGSWWS
jgi:hypothetical protein